MRGLTLSLALGVIALSGCGDSALMDSATAIGSEQSDEQLASATLSRMREVAASGDWAAYVDDFYGEQHKFRSSADRDKLVLRFEAKWGDQLVEGLDRAATLPVRIDGDVALFEDGSSAVFKLHRDEQGDWKFHL